MSFSDRLKTVREEAGLSQVTFGAMGGVQKLSQIKYESGARNPDVKYLESLQNHGIDIGYLLTNERKPSEHPFKVKDALLRLMARISQDIKGESDHKLNKPWSKAEIDNATNMLNEELRRKITAFILENHKYFCDKSFYDSMIRSLTLE